MAEGLSHERHVASQELASALAEIYSFDPPVAQGIAFADGAELCAFPWYSYDQVKASAVLAGPLPLFGISSGSGARERRVPQPDAGMARTRRAALFNTMCKAASDAGLANMVLVTPRVAEEAVRLSLLPGVNLEELSTSKVEDMYPLQVLLEQRQLAGPAQRAVAPGVAAAIFAAEIAVQPPNQS